MVVQIQKIRKEIEEYLKVMGYYASDIKLTSTKSKGSTILITGYFHEYLSSNQKFSASYDETNGAWIEFLIEDTTEGYP